MSGRAPQLVLALGHDPSHAAADFVGSPSNRAAMAWIERYPDWPGPLLALYGPAGSGKSHLLQLWRRRAGAIAPDARSLRVDALPRIVGAAHALALDLAEEDLASEGPTIDRRALLHLYNLMNERGGHILIAARLAPAHWRVDLPDLRSRLAAAPSVAIEPPDDALLAAVLAKLFADRQLRPDAEVVAYLTRRIERSLAAAGRIVAALDAHALAHKRAITVALARELLEQPIQQ